MIINLVNNLLDLAKIESIKFKLVEEFFDIGQVIEEACYTMQPEVHLSSINLQHRLNVNLSDKSNKMIKRKIEGSYLTHSFSKAVKQEG